MINLKKNLNFVENELNYFFNDLNDSNKNLKLFIKFNIENEYSYTNKDMSISEPKRKFCSKIINTNTSLKKSNKSVF